MNNCKNYNIKKIIYASSSSVYGGNYKYPSKENFDLKPNNIYSLTKKNNEELAQLFCNYYNLNLIGLRFFTVFGPWGRPDMLTLKLLDKIKKKETFQINNFGNHSRDFTYIDDVINMMVNLFIPLQVRVHLILDQLGLQQLLNML